MKGRTDDTFSFEEDGRTIRLLPLALGAVIEETPGVRRFQAIKTAPKALSVRLEVEPGANPQRVWEALTSRLEEYFSAQVIVYSRGRKIRGAAETQP